VKTRTRRDVEVFSLSFLDCVCCGFGAIILLLTLVRMGEPQAIEQAREDLQGRIARLERELYEIRGETTLLSRELVGKREQLSVDREAVARLQGDLERLRGEFKASRELSQVQDVIEGRFLAAQQQLTEEMKRLQAESQRRPAGQQGLVGGIPVDSEYVIFVIDTSGSMQRFAWPALLRKMSQTLDAYPKVKGLQVMNDEGVYMFPTYASKWIPDTPGRRQAVIQRLAGWNAYSNSSPVEGIEAAIRTLAKGDLKISIYVLGDEFTGRSVEGVLRAVDSMNRRTASGARRVRIHAIGFPTLFSASAQAEFSETTTVRFAMLMRALCERNGGAFVGLNSLEP
jgi:hypothetical protein